MHGACHNKSAAIAAFWVGGRDAVRHLCAENRTLLHVDLHMSGKNPGCCGLILPPFPV